MNLSLSLSLSLYIYTHTERDVYCADIYAYNVIYMHDPANQKTHKAIAAVGRRWGDGGASCAYACGGAAG